MMTEMHRQIVEKVWQTLKLELNINLDIERLKQGSVIPDRYIGTMFIPHTIHGSRHILDKNIHWLTNTYLPENKRQMRKFSFRLGIALHYISDYFCRAHNDVHYRGIFRHYFYERKLREFYTEIWKAEPLLPNNTKEINIKEYIKSKHSEYLNTKMSMKDDITFAEQVCTEVALKIALTSLSRKYRLIA